MENEIMNYNEEETTMDEITNYEAESEETGIGTGVAMLIGAGLTLATTAAVKLGKKLWQSHKAKKELRKPDEDSPVEVTDEKIKSVTK